MASTTESGDHRNPWDRVWARTPRTSGGTLSAKAEVAPIPAINRTAVLGTLQLRIRKPYPNPQRSATTTYAKTLILLRSHRVGRSNALSESFLLALAQIIVVVRAKNLTELFRSELGARDE